MDTRQQQGREARQVYSSPSRVPTALNAVSSASLTPPASSRADMVAVRSPSVPYTQAYKYKQPRQLHSA